MKENASTHLFNWYILRLLRIALVASRGITYILFKSKFFNKFLQNNNERGCVLYNPFWFFLRSSILYTTNCQNEWFCVKITFENVLLKNPLENTKLCHGGIINRAIHSIVMINVIVIIVVISYLQPTLRRILGLLIKLWTRFILYKYSIYKIKVLKECNDCRGSPVLFA